MLASAGVAHLTLVLQGREVRKFVLNPGVTTIGRAQDNDIVINNLALSRRHAQVEKKGPRYEVSDLGSQNGVFVNSERVRAARPLENADTITLGTYHFVFTDSAISDPDVRAVQAHSKREPAEVTELGDQMKSEPAREKEPDAEHAPLLVLKYNDVELQRFPLRGAGCLIGRAKECQVQIAERRLSRKHCEIVRNEGDRWFVKDLGSQNGTYVNRKRIRDFHNLQHGDVLNFAEYAVLYLSDGAAYDGPDLVHARRQAAEARSAPGPGPRPGSEIGVEETDFPEAYSEGLVGFDVSNAPSVVPDDDRPLHPSDLDEDPELLRTPRAPMRHAGELRGAAPRRLDAAEREPLIEEPQQARERRKQPPKRGSRPEPHADLTPPPGPPPEKLRIRPVEPKNHHPPAKRPAPVPPTDPQAPRRPAKKPAPAREAEARERREMIEDIPDDLGDVRPDSSLDDWYKAREEKSEVFEEEDSSVLLRSKSSVSKILSTMMVDKKELDRNLSLKARQRKFFVDVTRGSEKVYSGPLTQPVTILGTDREADIQLKGRYVAGRHSILVRVRDSLLLVRLGSSSAARVNGLPKLQAFLKTGDVIQIDETTIKITED